MANNFDVIIVGAGMAGASLAYELSAYKKVLLLEAESQPGYHSTGRSAAAFIPSYGFESDPLRNLTMTSREFLEAPPTDFSDRSFLHQRGLLYLAKSSCQSQLTALHESLSEHFEGIQWLEGQQISEQIPAVKPDYLSHAVFEKDVFDIDVHSLHQSYLKGFKARGGILRNNTRVTQIDRIGEYWLISAESLSFQSEIVVNAAGAWSDTLATMAGVQHLNIQPKRRTAILVDPQSDVSHWPLALEIEAGFYFKPDAGKLLVSPADEHPSAACDAAPEELDIAFAAHYAQSSLDINFKKVDHSWAGLRCFAPDRNPVVGFDQHVRNFFWLSGQGGHGIQIAPAAARFACSLIADLPLPDDLLAANFSASSVCPSRFSHVESHYA